MSSSRIFVVSFSGGKDSTTMLFKLIEHKQKIDYILFNDTEVEYPEMYKHIDKVDKLVKKLIGINITRLKAVHGFFYYLLEYKRKRGEYKGLPYPFPSPLYRWCTRNLKLIPTANFLKQFSDKQIINYIGYSFDEKKRARNLVVKKSNKNIIYKFPLIKLKITEQQALDYMYSLGFDYNGLYDNMKKIRLSCYLCTLQPLENFCFLLKNYPDLWNKIKAVEQYQKSLGMKHWKFHFKGLSTDDIEQFCKNNKI